MDYLNAVIDSLDRSHSVFHVVSIMAEELKKNGFIELWEDEPFTLEKGKGYFVSRNNSSIIAFYIPEDFELGYRIGATHNDSPSFAVKPNPFMERSGNTCLNVEPYGGGIFYTWLDRPLSIAGRVFVKEGDEIEERLIDVDEDLLVIPSLAIHMNREVNKGYEFNAAKDMVPLFLEESYSGTFSDFLKEACGIEGDVISHDLFLYVRESPRLVGESSTLLLAPRLDDLSSAYANLYGFIEGVKEKSQGYISVFASFDNEEVGSLTRQGANSDFLKSTLTRLGESLGMSKEEQLIAIANAIMLSVDNAHASHPNHMEKSDPTSIIHLNQGIVIKYNADQKYTTNAESSCYVKSLCSALEQPYQEFTNRSDLRGGSTLGNISNSEVSILSADIGIAQLAMHSSVEVCGAVDIDDMGALLCLHYQQ
ncbi:MAG: M18 family aminopeptidase [Bacilli bacterium]|nr:M18 family aminopeptidase [Bacilli bacterium]